MRFRDDNRGVTVQVGAVLLFATLVIALATYQAVVVPSQNADVEYKHSQQVQGDLMDVRNSLLSAAASGSSQPVSVDLGTGYPSRVFLINPPPAAGTLETRSYANDSIRVSNVAATDGETRDYIDGSWSASTKFLAYQPGYHEYRDAPTLLYESSILSNFFPEEGNGTAVPLTEQLVVDSETRTISLVSLNGSLGTSKSGAASVSPEALSAPSRRVQVQPKNTDEPVNVSIPTKVSAATLENSTSLGDHPGVVDVVDDPSSEDRVVITVEWDEPFTLQTAKVGVGSETTNPEPYYLTIVEQGGGSVTVEARDRFNNPESGVQVNASGGFGSDSAVTDVDGQATFDVNGGGELTILGGDDERERVDVSPGAGGGGGGGAYAVQWDTAAIESQTGVEYYAGNDTVVIDVATPGTPDPAAFTAGVTNASGDAVAGVEVDFATTDQSVVQFSPSAAETDGSGESTTDAGYDLGRATAYAEAGGSSDSLGVKVIDGSGGGPPTPQVDFRLDDLTLQNEDSIEYVGSYSVTNTNSSFERVEVEYANTNDGSATQTLQKAGTRGGLRYTSSYGAGDTYDVTVRVIYDDGSGEYVAAADTVTDVADAANPSGNDDLSTASTASLSSSTIEDRSNPGQGPEYRFDYAVSTGGYTQTELVVVSTGSGAKASTIETARSGSGVDVNPGYGYNQPFKVAILVYGPDGAVVDARIVSDTADGVGP